MVLFLTLRLRLAAVIVLLVLFGGLVALLAESRAQEGAPATPAAADAGLCEPYSALECSAVRANLPLSLGFSGDEGGLLDGGGKGTGLGMTLPSTNGGRFRPERLEVADGKLTIRTTRGIQFKTATTTANGNSLDNGLGVGVDASRKLRMETTLVNPPLGTGAAEQGGLWFGPTEDDYAKLVVASARTGSTVHHRVQLLRERGGVSDGAQGDEVNTTTRLDFSSQTVRLILVADPAGKVTASYRVGDGAEQSVGELAVPPTFFDGTKLGANLKAEGATGLAGVFATHRNNTTTTGLAFAFGELSIAEVAAPAAAPNAEVAPARLVVNDAVGGDAGRAQAVTVRNTGDGPLAVQGVTLAGAAPEQFAVIKQPAATVAPGASTTAEIAMKATATGPKGAIAVVATNDPDAPTAEVTLRGLGTAGTSGSGEPSLQWVLDAHEIPVSVGDDDPATAVIHSSTTTRGAARLGDENPAQAFRRAGTGPVTVEPLAVFAPSSHDPVLRFGRHTPGAPAAKTQLLTVGSTHAQALDVPGGVRAFDPGAEPFALYSSWPAFADREVFGEDALNTFTGAIPHHVRVYPLKSRTGAVVPEAYVVATEEHVSGFDYQDLVVVLRGVEAIEPPSKAEIALENLDKVPFADRLAFNRIQTPNAEAPNGVHDSAVLRVRNTGTDPLRIDRLPVEGPWQLVGAPALPATVAPGGQLDLTVKFVATTLGPDGGRYEGSLTIRSNDADEPAVPVELGGFWQSVSEGGQEPDVGEIVEVFGYGTTITKPGQRINNGGRVLKVGDEIHSPYFKRADLTKPVVVRQLGAFHIQPGRAEFRTTLKATGTARPKAVGRLLHHEFDAQSLLPRSDPDRGAGPGEASFTPANWNTGTTDGTDAADGVFGIQVDSEHSDWKLNVQDSGCVAEKLYECGHHVRVFPAEDRDGKLIPNQFLVAMDYSGINYDFNDNVYLVANVKPEDPANDPSVPKPCAPVDCDRIAVDTPLALDFDAPKAGTVPDAAGDGTGFTHVAPSAAGAGYVKPNLDLAGGRLEIATTKGLAFGAANTQDNALAVGLKWNEIAKPQAITTTLADLPAGTGQFQQAGLWFGRGEDDYVKLVALSTPEGIVVQALKEEGGASPNGTDFKSPVLPLAGARVALKLVADPVARRVTASYTAPGAGETPLGAFTVPASWFSEDADVIDPRIGTSSFAGILASHRNGPAALTYAFDAFAVADDTTAQRPVVTASRPADGATDVVRDVALATDLRLPSGGVDTKTLSASSVRLVRDTDAAPVAGTPGTSGAGDTITFTPAAPLAASTRYRFEVTDEVRDTSGERFVPFTARFTTGTRLSSDGTGTSTAAFDKVALPTATGAYQFYSQLTFGPDGKLYAAMNDGRIRRFPVLADGTLGQPETITTLVPDFSPASPATKRLLVGLRFDPASTAEDLVVWASHTTWGFNDMADWGGKITRLSGPDLQDAQDYVVGLPRSTRDHVTNGIDFGPDGKLYVLQGSNSAMGAPDGPWGNRPERVLSAAVLRLDPAKVANPPLNVRTEDGGAYDPYAADAALTIFGSGIRNAYDLVWHSAGRLYVPTNGSAAGGNAPGTPATLPAACSPRRDGAYTAPAVPGLNGVPQTQHDWLFRVTEGGYYGHPNPKRCEWVLNGGDPTPGADGPAEVPAYPDGTQPDRNYRGAAFDFGLNKSPNGVIEYRSNAFGGSLKGKLLVVRYSNNDDIVVLDPSEADGDIGSSQTGIPGTSGFKDPLDLTEDPRTGNLYVTEYDQTGQGQRITLLKVRDSAPADCSPYSTLPCAQVGVALPRATTWSGPEGGLAGTGFTMVQPSSNGGRFLPERVAVDAAAGTLTITSTKGIAYKTATTTTNGNSLDNGLGVGLDTSRKLRLETTLVNPPKGTGASEQAGMWFGPDEDNHVKLVVSSFQNDATPHRVQLLREVGGVSGTGDEINTTASDLDFSGSTVRLVLELDPATRKATASYRVGGGDTVALGELAVPASLFDGTRVTAPGIDGFAGIFATHRNNRTTSGLAFTFGEFGVTAEAAPNRAPVLDAIADRTTVAGDAVSLVPTASDADGDTLTWSATGLPAGLSLAAATGAISGSPADEAVRTEPYTVTVEVSDGEATAQRSFAWTVTAPPAPPAFTGVKVNFQNATAAVPAGHLRDFGQPFGSRTSADQGSGLRYGWVLPGTATPLDLSTGGTQGNGRERNLASDQRYDTLVHAQADDVPNFSGTPTEGAWEIAVPDGTYVVTAAVGDPAVGADPERHTLRAEGETVIDGFEPSGAAGSATRHATATAPAVTVTDGRLTLDAVGGRNTKLDFVEIAKAPSPPVNRPPALTDPADQTTREGAAVAFDVSAADPDAEDTLTFEATGLPSGLTMAPATGRISGTVDLGAARTTPYPVTVTVTDGAAASDTATFAWTITDGIAPTVTAVRPAAGAGDVALGAAVRAEFSERVTPGAFTLRKQGAADALPATVAYDAATRTATLVPTGGLDPSTTYVATMAGARDEAGNTMAETRTWMFTTVPPAPGELVATPPSVAFGEVQVDDSAVREVVLRNAGGARSATIRVASVTADGAGFSDDADAFELAPGAEKTVRVTFAPTAAGARTASLRVAHDGANAALALPLTGTGTPKPAARLALTPAPLAFGSVTVEGSEALDLEVRNAGTAPATLGAATLSGTDAAQFRVAGAPRLLGVGERATVSVTFAPTSPGAKEATLTLPYEGGPGSPATVTLTGTGAPKPAPRLTVDPATLAFGALEVGEAKGLSVKVSNTGTASTTITGATLGGADAGEFRAPAERPQIAAGASAQVPVVFAPGSAGAKAATLTLAYGGGSVSVTLSGTGTTTSPPPARGAVRINAGGPGQTVNGVTWQGCTTVSQCSGYVSGGFPYKRAPGISGIVSPANQAVYQTEWTGGQTNGVRRGAVAFAFSVPVPAGTYKTRLHFAEIVQNGVGKRVFDVNVEGGAKELEGFDVFRSAGGLNKAIVREFTHTVTDGKLSIEFIRQVENAKVSGIEIIPVPAPEPRTVRINAGGPAQTVGGIAWSGCTAIRACSGWVSGGFPYKRAPGISGIVSPANQAVYQTEWTGGQTNGVPRGAVAFAFRVPVANASYRVRLHFAEIVQNGIGKRVFDVNLEGGAKELVGFDVFAEGRGLNRAFVRELPVTVTDGVLSIEFIRQVENAKVSGIEIIPATTVAAPAAASLQLGAAAGTGARATRGPRALAGRLVARGARGGKRIVLERRRAGAKRWSSVAAVTTDASGAFRLSATRLAAGARYRTRFAGDGELRPAVSRAAVLLRRSR